MLRKKLIALGLIGITAVAVTASNTTISIAAPTNLEASDNMMKDIVIRGVDSLEKLVNEGNYDKANSWRKQVNHQLTALAESGEDVADLQKTFNELSKKIDILGEKKKKLDEMRQGIKDSITDIMYALNNKEYDNIPDMFKYLSDDMDKLSKYEPIDKAVLDRILELKDKYDNREKIDQAKEMVKSLSTDLDNLSKSVKEKNLNESISLRQQIDSEMKKLAKLSTIPGFVKNRFDLYSEKVDKLIVLKEEAKNLKNEINNLFNKLENFINVKEYNNAKESLDKALEKINKLENIESLENSLTTRLVNLRNGFDKMEKVTPAKPVAPVNAMQPVNLFNDVQPVNPSNAVQPVNEVNPTEPVNSIVQPVNSVRSVAKSEKSKEVEKVNAVNLESKENLQKEEVKVNNKVVEVKQNDNQALKSVIVEKANEATENQNVLPKTGSPIGAEGLLGLGAAMSALGAMTLRKFRKN